MIDWDFAGPGDPLNDASYLAFCAVPMLDDDYCRDCGFDEIPDRLQRLRVVCEAYGPGATPGDLVARAERHQLNDIDEIETFGPQGLAPWAGFLEMNLHERARELLAWLQENRSLLVSSQGKFRARASHREPASTSRC
jgi:hypothetical protein